MFLPGTDSRLACQRIQFIILLFSGIYSKFRCQCKCYYFKGNLSIFFALKSFLLCVVFCSFITTSVGVDFFLLVLLGVCWDFWNLWIDVFHQFGEILNWLSRLANIPITKVPPSLGLSLDIFLLLDLGLIIYYFVCSFVSLNILCPAFIIVLRGLFECHSLSLS